MANSRYTGCVYIATNLNNGALYIGKSLSGLAARRKTHFSAARNGKPWPFCCAIRKHGENAFVWDILYLSDDNDALSIAEMSLIASHIADDKRLYNATEGGDGTRRKWPAEDRAKMKARGMPKACRDAGIAAWTPERKAKHSQMLRDRDRTGVGAKISAAKTGKKRDPEVVARIAESNRGKKLPPWTEERRAKMLAAKERGCFKNTPEIRAAISAGKQAAGTSEERRAQMREHGKYGALKRWGHLP